MNLPQLPQDKANHVLYGLAIAIVVSVVAMLLKMPQPRLIGFVVAVVFAGGKEALDYLLNKKDAAAGKVATRAVEKLDFVATVVGSAVVPVLGFLP